MMHNGLFIIANNLFSYAFKTFIKTKYKEVGLKLTIFMGTTSK